MSGYQIRRATVDDRPALIELWRAAHLPTEPLEPAFTDFQVAEDESGRIVAAIALQVEGSSGRVHAEAFSDFGLTDELRPILWQRLLLVAKGYGLFRLWTEERAPWWKKHAGFEPAADSVKHNLPEAFGSPSAPWLMLRLREETPDDIELEKKIAELKERQRARTAALAHRAYVIRLIMTIVAALLWVLAMIALVYALRHRS